MSDDKEAKKSPYKKVEHGGKVHENMIVSAYGLTLEEADDVLARRAKDVNTVSLDEFQRAKSLTKALRNKPKVTSQFAVPFSNEDVIYGSAS